MKVLSKLSIKLDKEDKELLFGLVETKEELKKARQLRFQVYNKCDYIDSNRYTKNEESDQMDENKSTEHLIACIDGDVIGNIRIIQDSPLPTEKYFTFSRPEVFEGIDNDNLAELGRLVAVPYKNAQTYLPRGLIFLFLIHSLVIYYKEKGYLGGYAFIKEDLEKKMVKRGMPLHIIKEAKQDYPKNGALSKYFNQKDNKVKAIYFLTEEFEEYTKKILNERLIFKKLNKEEYCLKLKSYNLYLKLARAI